MFGFLKGNETDSLKIKLPEEENIKYLNYVMFYIEGVFCKYFFNCVGDRMWTSRG